MRVLRKGSRGEDVERWQLFLVGQGFELGEADSVFGGRTHAATKSFQAKYELTVDGIVGAGTLGKAMQLGFDVGLVDDTPEDDETSTQWPPRPAFPPLVTTAARQQVFGRFDFTPNPTPGNPEGIKISGTWVQDNIQAVEIPQLRGISGAPANGVIQAHRAIASQLRALWAAWDQAGLLNLVKSWAGSFVPRFVRGSRTTLSNHAFGTAFDINAPWNGLGMVPAVLGRPGSVRALVPLAHAHGFYWGGHFSRPDGMHFEAAVVLRDDDVSKSAPKPSPNAKGGRAILESTSDQSFSERERVWLDQLRAGNFPDFLRARVAVTTTALVDGELVEAEVDVAPDYVAVGTNDDFVRVPFGQAGAAEAAAILGGVLPTTRLVDAIYAQADVRLAPIPQKPGPEMTSAEYILRHHHAIEAKRARKSGLVAGHKKDVVITNRLRFHPDRVAIYGWHQLNGVAIQPLSLVHESTYADYSHGIRVIAPVARVDGVEIPVKQLLADPSRAVLLSSEGTIVLT